MRAVDRPLAMTLAFREVIYVHGSSSALKPVPSARRAPEMRILLSSRRTSPLVFDRTQKSSASRVLLAVRSADSLLHSWVEKVENLPSYARKTTGVRFSNLSRNISCTNNLRPTQSVRRNRGRCSRRFVKLKGRITSCATVQRILRKIIPRLGRMGCGTVK